MRHVVILEDSERLVIEPSHTFRNIRVWIPGTPVILNIPAEHAGTVALAIQACQADIAQADRLTGAEG